MSAEVKRPSLTEVCTQLEAHRLPRWEEIPELELYMDQVLSLVHRYLNAYPGYEEKGLTASMVNNYVKAGLLPPPVKKRYTRVHLARLLVICVLKASLPIPMIGEILGSAAIREDQRDFYDRFCRQFETTNREVASAYRNNGADSLTDTVCRAALRAQAEQALAGRLSPAVSTR